jgi:ribosomal protein L34
VWAPRSPHASYSTAHNTCTIAIVVQSHAGTANRQRRGFRSNQHGSSPAAQPAPNGSSSALGFLARMQTRLDLSPQAGKALRTVASLPPEPKPDKRSKRTHGYRERWASILGTKIRWSCQRSGLKEKNHPLCKWFSPKWWQDPESNRGHEDFQSSALPTELSCRTKMNGGYYAAAKWSDKPFRRWLRATARRRAECQLAKLGQRTSLHEVINP